jgi:hypothetical protein
MSHKSVMSISLLPTLKSEPFSQGRTAGAELGMVAFVFARPFPIFSAKSLVLITNYSKVATQFLRLLPHASARNEAFFYRYHFSRFCSLLQSTIPKKSERPNAKKAKFSLSIITKVLQTYGVSLKNALQGSADRTLSSSTPSCFPNPSSRLH